MRYRKVEREDLAAGVARQLRVAIIGGELQPGELLPPERRLAEQFGVDRHTLRSALSELEQLGLVERRQGSGSRVLDFHETGTLDLLRHLVEPGEGRPDPGIVAQAVEVGNLTFKGLMDLVVDRATPDDLSAMRTTLERLAVAGADGDPHTIVAAERRFYRTVFKGAHSLVAELVANTYDQIFDAAIDPDGRFRLQWVDEVVVSGRLDAYAQVVDAIDRRDHAEARRIVDIVLSGIPVTVTGAPTGPVAGAGTRRRRAAGSRRHGGA